MQWDSTLMSSPSETLGARLLPFYVPESFILSCLNIEDILDILTYPNTQLHRTYPNKCYTTQGLLNTTHCDNSYYYFFLRSMGNELELAFPDLNSLV